MKNKYINYLKYCINCSKLLKQKKYVKYKFRKHYQYKKPGNFKNFPEHKRIFFCSKCNIEQKIVFNSQRFILFDYMKDNVSISLEQIGKNIFRFVYRYSPNDDSVDTFEGGKCLFLKDGFEYYQDKAKRYIKNKIFL